MTGEVSRAGIGFQIVETGEAAAEDEHLIRSGEHAAVMTRPGKTPGNFLAGERMKASLLLAGQQIKRPGLGNDPAADKILTSAAFMELELSDPTAPATPPRRASSPGR